MIDLTNVALRRSPHEKFEGPILRADKEVSNLRFVGIVDGRVIDWAEDGVHSHGDRGFDLIPYTPAPVARKWLKCNHGRPAPMIERAAAEALVDALRLIESGKVHSILQARDISSNPATPAVDISLLVLAISSSSPWKVFMAAFDVLLPISRWNMAMSDWSWRSLVPSGS